MSDDWRSVLGGSVNRPGSRAEIEKLPQSKCFRCGLVAVKPIVVAHLCTNEIACLHREQAKLRAKP